MKTLRIYNPPLPCVICKLKVALWEKLKPTEILCYSCRQKIQLCSESGRFIEITQEGL